MDGYNFFALFPLQQDLSYMWVQKESSSNNIAIFIIFVAVIAIVVLLLSGLKKGAFRTGGGSGANKTSPFALRKLIKSIGLNNEQAKMLTYVFKLDEVVDPERSLSVPTLLDQHFRRAYRAIEQAGDNDPETRHKLAVLFSTRNTLENTTIGAITSTRQIKEETKLTINFNKEKITAVVHSAKEDFLSIDVPKNVLGSQIKIPKGAKLNVLFFGKGNKSFTFETHVAGNANLRGHPVLQLAHSNNINFLSKRRFRRRQTVIACFIFLVYVESVKKKQRLIVDKRRISGSIADISVGGCSIKTTVPVQVGAKFKIEFTQGDEKVAALGQVLRTNKTGINHVIHMKFLRVTQKSMNMINAYVYEYAQE